MKRKATHGHDRTVAITWGLIAEISLGGVLLVWFLSPGAAGRAAFGSLLSLGLLTAALVVTAVGVVAAFAPRMPRNVARWGITAPLAAVMGAVGSLAGVSIMVPQDMLDAGAGLLLALSMVGIYMIMMHTSRKSASTGES